ncbi:MAG: hypothetical protein WA705_23195 [Candidatus Ozemobacteraceae bacterium]|jgi:hypothetical protein
MEFDHLGHFENETNSVHEGVKPYSVPNISAFENNVTQKDSHEELFVDIGCQRTKEVLKEGRFIVQIPKRKVVNSEK